MASLFLLCWQITLKPKNELNNFLFFFAFKMTGQSLKLWEFLTDQVSNTFGWSPRTERYFAPYIYLSALTTSNVLATMNFVRCTSQIFKNNDDYLNDKKHLLLFQDGSLVKKYTFVSLRIISLLKVGQKEQFF